MDCITLVAHVYSTLNVGPTLFFWLFDRLSVGFHLDELIDVRLVCITGLLLIAVSMLTVLVFVSHNPPIIYLIPFINLYSIYSHRSTLCGLSDINTCMSLALSLQCQIWVVICWDLFFILNTCLTRFRLFITSWMVSKCDGLALLLSW